MAALKTILPAYSSATRHYSQHDRHNRLRVDWESDGAPGPVGGNEGLNLRAQGCPSNSSWPCWISGGAETERRSHIALSSYRINARHVWASRIRTNETQRAAD